MIVNFSQTFAILNVLNSIHDQIQSWTMGLTQYLDTL